MLFSWWKKICHFYTDLFVHVVPAVPPVSQYHCLKYRSFTWFSGEGILLKFRQLAQNSAETVRFHKIFTTGNQVKSYAVYSVKS